MVRKAGGTIALLVLGINLTACYSLVEKPVLKRRDFQPFPTKEYMAPCKFIQVEDINLAYVEAGQGPTVILLHGGVSPINFYDSLFLSPEFDFLALMTANTIPPRGQTFGHLGAIATIETWQYNLAELAKHFHVLALDLPGFGNSDKPDIKYELEDFTRYLAGFMDAKGIEHASLVGLDLGAMIAMDFALAHPERVDKLVLVNIIGLEPGLIRMDPVVPMLSRMIQKNDAARINVWIPLYRRMFLKKAVRNVLHEPSQDLRVYYILEDKGAAKEFLDQVTDYKLNYTKSKEFTQEVHALHHSLVNLKRAKVLKRLTLGASEIKAPTLIIWGIKNPYPPKKSGTPQFLDETMPCAALNTFNRSGHFPMVEEPERFNRQVIQFLTGEVPNLAAAAP